MHTAAFCKNGEIIQLDLAVHQHWQQPALAALPVVGFEKGIAAPCMAYVKNGEAHPLDDLEGGIGLPGAGRHNEEMAVVAFVLGNGFNGAVNGDLLVVAR